MILDHVFSVTFEFFFERVRSVLRGVLLSSLYYHFTTIQCSSSEQEEKRVDLLLFPLSAPSIYLKDNQSFSKHSIFFGFLSLGIEKGSFRDWEG
jgi:hypothetical protein